MGVIRTSKAGITTYGRYLTSSASPATYANYFGDGSDGAVTIATNTSLTTLNKSGSYSADMLVKNYSSLTINSGVTLTTDQPCRGLLIYVSGNCVINGTLSMTARGAAADPTIAGASDNSAVDANGLKFPFLTQGGTSSLGTSSSLLSGCGNAAKAAIAKHPTLISNGTVITIKRVGAAGAAQTAGGTPITPNAGSNGVTGESGGGGSGGGYYASSYGGAGGVGSCFSGGSGGGGVHSVSGGTSQAGTSYGGAGGAGYYPDGGYSVPGGIGNPNGLWSNGSYTSNNGISNSAGGTGGLIVLIVGGTLTINSGGSIQANGVSGPNFNNADRGGGGASGGGNVVVVHRGLSNSGSVTATGGAQWGWNASQIGGAGGNGSVQILQVS